jgi:circadian clock protein KaiC
MAKGKEKAVKFLKSPTGIAGLDEITLGGLPKNRTTLIAGTVGSDKTIMGMEIIIKGAVEFKEPGIFMAFEETVQELIMNVSSLGYDVKKLIEKKQLYIEHIELAPTEFLKGGELNLEGLFIRIERAIDKIGAKRIVLDSFGAFFYRQNSIVFRSEVNKLFVWLKQKGITAIITEESVENSLTRQGMEEYVSDCVIKLENRINNRISTRLLRIVKYRDSRHGNNEYPFIIDEKGMSLSSN